MTVLNVLVYVALIGYIVFRRVQGQPVKAGRKLFVLPVVLLVLGYGDVTQGTALKPLEIALIVIGGILSLGLGLLRGRADKLSDRDGSPFVQWGVASVILFVGNLAAKLVLDIIGIAAGSTSSAVGKSLVLTFGLTLLGEAVVIWMRTGGAAGVLDPRRPTAARSSQPGPDRFADATRRAAEESASRPTAARSLAEAIETHHEHHHDHHHDHDHGHRRERERS